ncbi:hypothetical protein ASPZODRAFT_141649 [Penicilliopsis zonata CBS 506.65]|uniref:N-acetyltransferase domain-containing protein n=1 Tax=Penicilliopsis zonata CBS 506.65 TaxID=1073090 RepID=A0A1L9SIC0_9EURO|nr:hypothetical protein ASPZODRAFT_141649 [Penicilliopsis zonata CBS 506.65]OJJ46866.1 hypothetical protein ASPZODRAFT_141649 [Penicilliopsis zonata CBS 506.65]
MAIEITPLTKADIAGSIECIQKAFADDPYFLWLFDQTKFNVKRNTVSLTGHYLHGLHTAAPVFVAREVPSAADSTEKAAVAVDEVECASSSSSSSSASVTAAATSPESTILGISSWYAPHPPGNPEPWSHWVQEWILSIRQLVNIIRFGGRGGLNVKRYKTWKARQAEAQAKVWTDPRGYYFCNVVAVDDRARGKGVGRKLIEAVTRRADEEGMPCYLESSKLEPNVAIYRKMGFELVDEITCEEGGEQCTLYAMIRQPQTKA